MAAPDKTTGKAMALTLSGTSIKVTKISAKASPKQADSTDTGNYSATTDLVHPSQINTTLPIELSVEGYYYKTQTPTAIVSKLFDPTSGPFAVTFTVATGYAHFGGNYDISDFQIESQFDDMVNVSFTLKSNGVVNANS
jgi:hypothetical protein